MPMISMLRNPTQQKNWDNCNRITIKYLKNVCLRAKFQNHFWKMKKKTTYACV